VARTEKGQKYNRIPAYTKADGTKVKAHVRSNPSTSDGPAKGRGGNKRR
jgi:hypothetical protein